MVIYAVGIMPLIWKLDCTDKERHQVWFADDASGTGSLRALLDWWMKIQAVGPSFGYFVNPTKTVLIVKEQSLQDAESLFDGTGIKVTTEAQNHLGVALGSRLSKEKILEERINDWVNTIKSLLLIATTQPHAAYSAFTHGIRSQWSYLMRTVTPLKNTIRELLIPAMTGREINDDVRQLLALPTRLGGLGLINPIDQAAREYEASIAITQPLVTAIKSKENEYSQDIVSNQHMAKKEMKQRKQLQQEAIKEDMMTRLLSNMKKNVMMAQEKGKSAWLNALPIREHGFALHKSDFRDALCLRYNWHPPRLPVQCACGHGFTINHAMDCHTGGFPSKRHNDVRDLTAKLLTEVCPGVAIEPTLQPLNGEQFVYGSANREDNARADICAQGFWGSSSQRAFFDIRICNPNAPTYYNSSLEAIYRRQEKEKCRQYDE